MYNIYKIMFVAIFMAALNPTVLAANVPPSSPFKKVHGSAEDEIPNRIMEKNGSVYVIGQVEVGGDYYAMFSKFDGNSGALICEQRLNIESTFNDLDYNPSTQEFVVVGGTDRSINSKSIMCTFDLNCNLINQKTYDQFGREEFMRVVVHKNPVDPGNAIYVLGRKASAATPPTFDITVVYNYDDNLNMNWAREYNEVGGKELETFRGFTDLSSGHLIIVGNGTNTNEGALIHINGIDGDFLDGIYYLDAFDIYDAIEVPSTGDIILAGTDFGDKEGLLMIVGPTFQHKSTKTYQGVTTFYDLGLDQYNFVYVTAKRKSSSGLLYPVVHKMEYVHQSSNTSYFIDTWFKYYLDGETTFSDPHLYVSHQTDNIYFTDGRNNPVVGFGENDLLISKTSLDFDTCCVEIFSQSTVIYDIMQSTFDCNETSLTEPALEPNFNPVTYMDDCRPYCDNPVCDFDAVINCFTVNFTALISGGTPPYVIDWNINCDATIEQLNSPTYTHTFPPLPSPGIYQVCMTMTDALGVQCQSMQFVEVKDVNAPSLACPILNPVYLSTIPGQCHALYNVSTGAYDNCDPSPVVSCQYTGATTGSSGNMFNVGTTHVVCTATDNSNNVSTCIYDIIVTDNEPPQIICPPDVTIQGYTCDSMAFYPRPVPVFSDNCPGAGLVSPPYPNFFPCGTTEVTYIAVDASGNRDTCSFNVTVDCACAKIVSKTMTCNPTDDDLLDFQIVVDNFSGSGQNPPCIPNITTPHGNVIFLNQNYSWVGSQLTITGSIYMSCNYLNSVQFDISMACFCPNTNETQVCDISTSISTICCKTILISDDEICRQDGNYALSLVGCNDFCDVQRVDWYIANAPCPPTTFGPPFQSTTDCRDLLLDPTQFLGDICVYAEIILGSADGPCQGVKITNVATINICDKMTVSVSPALQRYCYSGAPITPGPLVASPSIGHPACPYTIRWLKNGNPIAGANQLFYQPQALSLSSGSTTCSESFVFTCEISSQCGTNTSNVYIVLDNENAPDGTLVLDPNKTLPLCYGVDATLKYAEACTNPSTWTWLESTDGTTYAAITTNGTFNPHYNTNRMYADHWYRIEKLNGSCPMDQIDLHIPVRSQLQIQNFVAAPDNFCQPTGVDLSLLFTPDQPAGSGCTYDVHWYRNGNPIGVTSSVNSPISHFYPTFDVSGTYQAIIINSCCGEALRSPVDVILPTPILSLTGPCFRCNGEIITINSSITNLPTGFTCSYQWFDNNNIILGETNAILQVQPHMTGPFRLEVVCTNGSQICTLYDIYDLNQCGNPCPSIINLSGTVTSGVYHAANTLNITGHIPAGEVVIVRAGTNINIIQPFTVDFGAVFLTQYMACP